MGPLRKPTAQQPQPCPQHESEQIVKRPNHSGPEDHNQYNPDPLGHFLTIPWAATMLTDPAAFDIIVSDRRLVLSREHQFVRSVMSSETTVRACVTFCLKLPPNEEAGQKGVRPSPPFDGQGHGNSDGDHRPISKSKKLLSGGGPENGEDPERPFLIYNVLIDLGVGLSSFRGMLHGGAMAALLDEAMCAAVNNQSKYVFTATMTISFLKPARLPGAFIVRARVVKKQGRKLWVRGTLEDGDGEVKAESEALLMDQTPGRRSKL